MTDMPTRKRSAWMWIVVALIGVPLLYVLSFGPACWWFTTSSTLWAPVRCAPKFYWPIGLLADRTETRFLYRPIRWYATLNDRPVVVATDFAGSMHLKSSVVFYP